MGRVTKSSYNRINQNITTVSAQPLTTENTVMSNADNLVSFQHKSLQEYTGAQVLLHSERSANLVAHVLMASFVHH